MYSIQCTGPPACFSSQHLSLALKTFHLLRKLSQISLYLSLDFFTKKKKDTFFVLIATLLDFSVLSVMIKLGQWSPQSCLVSPF